MTMTADLYDRARALIPGATQLLSKRPELFLPSQWPAYFRRASGVEVEDLDGRTYTDVSWIVAERVRPPWRISPFSKESRRVAGSGLSLS